MRWIRRDAPAHQSRAYSCGPSSRTPRLGVYTAPAVTESPMKGPYPTHRLEAAAPPAADNYLSRRYAAEDASVVGVQLPRHSFITQANRSHYPAPQSLSPRPMPAAVHRSAVPVAGRGLLRPTAFTYNRPLLVLDLDETLVHASVANAMKCDFQFTVASEFGSVPVYVRLRPHVREFLQRVAQMFEVCVFTASVSDYADKVIDRLDPTGQLVHHRLFREHCTFVGGSYVKDLTRLGRSMEKLCLVDNSPITYSFQPENAFPISSWFDDPYDRELMRMMLPLEHFARYMDFFETQRRFRLYDGRS